ncbi:Kelch repeat-containing protein [[Eubacterium] cellulosolvens]
MIIIALLIQTSLFLLSPVAATTTWTQTSDGDFRNGTLNSLSILGDGPEAILLIDFPEISNSWTKKFPINMPIRRSSHAMATIYNTDQILLFSGYYYDIVNITQYQFQDTWVYDFGDNAWSEKSVLDNPGYRYGHEMAAVFDTDKVLLFGGASGQYRNDTWVYDLSENSWTNMNPKTSPSPRYIFGMAAVEGEDKIVLHGGSTTSGYNGETWVYDLSENSWVKKTPSGSPGRLIGHKLATIPKTDKVLLFGGMDQENHLHNDTWVYDVSDNSWSQKNPEIKPEARYLHSMASISGTDRTVVYGGYMAPTDTWVYDFSDNIWTKKTTQRSPSSRYYTGVAAVHGTKSVVLFGGTPGGYNYLNDTWVYEQQFGLTSGTFVSQPYHLPAEAAFKEIILNATTSAQSRIELQLRSAEQNAKLEDESFVGPDGNTGSFYTSFPGEIWEGHKSHQWIQYKAYFQTTNIEDPPILNEVKITFNYLPTTELLNPADRMILPDNFPIFKWNFNDLDSGKQVAFQVLIGNNIRFNDLVYDSGEQNSPAASWEFPVNTTYPYLPNGTWYWKVRTRDSDGDWGSFSPAWEFIINSRAPWSNVTWPMHDGFYNELNTITGHAMNYLDSNDINKIEISIKCLADDTYWSGNSWVDDNEIWLEAFGSNNWSYDSGSIEWTSGHRYAIRSRAVDIAMNIERPDEAYEFTFDSGSVVFSNPIPAFNDISDSESVSVGITIHDYISGVDGTSVEYAISFDDGLNWRPWESVQGLQNGSSINVSKNVVLPNGTDNRIKWRAVDVAGNGPTESEVYTVAIDTRLKKLKPNVNLVNPFNNSVITKSKVELKWSIVNQELKGITYDILLDTQYPPVQVIAADHQKNSLIVENLSNSETYYWTVASKNGAIMGECLSGVWSFSVELDFEIPEIVLNHPLNEQSIITKRPILHWYVTYYGKEQVSYDIYFGTDPNPELLAAGHTKTSYELDNDLDDQLTYYWRVVPRVNGKLGQGSDIWWFTVDTSYRPIDELKITIYQPEIVIKQDNFTEVNVQIKNFGKSPDAISLSVIIPLEIEGISVIISPPGTIIIPPGDTIEFNLTVIAISDAELGEFELTIRLLSQRAVELGLDSTKDGYLFGTVVENPDRGSVRKAKYDYTPFIYLVIVVIILLIVIYLRVESDRVFRNILRKVIYKTIEENPGIHFRQIMRELDLKPGVLAYHLNILEKKEYIKSRQKGIYRCFYLSNIKSDFKIVLSDLQQNILITINENPGITLTELSQALGKNKMVLNYNTHKLEDAGMIVKEKKGRIVSYSATSLAAVYIA